MEEGLEEPFEYEERDGLRLKYKAGEPGKYVGVTERKGKRKISYYARVCITKRKGDKRRQYALPGGFPSAVSAAIAIAKAELEEEGPASPEHGRKSRTCALLPPATRPSLFASDPRPALILVCSQQSVRSTRWATAEPATRRTWAAFNFWRSRSCSRRAQSRLPSRLQATSGPTLSSRVSCSRGRSHPPRILPWGNVARPTTARLHPSLLRGRSGQ